MNKRGQDELAGFIVIVFLVFLCWFMASGVVWLGSSPGYANGFCHQQGYTGMSDHYPNYDVNMSEKDYMKIECYKGFWLGFQDKKVFDVLFTENGARDKWGTNVRGFINVVRGPAPIGGGPPLPTGGSPQNDTCGVNNCSKNTSVIK